MNRVISGRPRWPLLLPLLCVSCAFEAVAATVYKTIDNNGVVSFSDTRPEVDQPVETLQIDATAPEVSAQDRQQLEDMRETTDRMVADRMSREKHRAELRQMQAESDAARQDTNYPADYGNTYIGYGSYYDGGYYHNRPNRPGHPIAKPPLRPGHDRPSARPLPRNNYPSSLVRRHYPAKTRAAFR